MLLWVSAYGVCIYGFLFTGSICFVWSVSMSVPGSRWVCLCVSPGLWRVCLFAQASGCISMYLCISTAVYDVFLPSVNHPVLMFFSGINHSSSTWSPMVCCYSRPSCYADEPNPGYWLGSWAAGLGWLRVVIDLSEESAAGGGFLAQVQACGAVVAAGGV